MTEKNLVKFQEGKEEEKNHEKVMIEVLNFFSRVCACRGAIIKSFYSHSFCLI